MATSTTERPMVEIAIPAEYIDEFRCALMDAMAHNGGWFRSTHDEMVERGDGDRSDRDSAVEAMRKDAAVLLQLPADDVPGTVAGTADLLHVIEGMARSWSEELEKQLEYGPANFRAAPALLERLSWCTEQATAIGGC